jgi:hypothetical protein
MAYEPPYLRRNQQGYSRAPLQQGYSRAPLQQGYPRAPLHLCIIDITGASAQHSANVFKRFIKETLEESEDLLYYDRETFNITYNCDNRQFQCYVNFRTVDEVEMAVNLFRNMQFEGATFESKYLDPNSPPKNWIRCTNQAVELIAGRYSRTENC